MFTRDIKLGAIVTLRNGMKAEILDNHVHDTIRSARLLERRFVTGISDISIVECDGEEVEYTDRQITRIDQMNIATKRFNRG